MAARLTLEDVSYSYPLPGREEAPALSGVGLEVAPGEVLCVAGANGSGKSTLAQVCAGLLVPTTGSVLYGGKPVEGRSGLLELRRKVGLLFQSPEDQLFADTVEKDMSFGPRNHGLRGDELSRVVSDAAALVDLPLEKLGGRSPFSLSEGEKRRVALAGVLALEPEVLLLDEPFIGLDAAGRDRLKSSLSRYGERKDASIVIVTHELSDSWDLADRFALLSAGRLERTMSRMGLISGGFDVRAVGMRLPQCGVLARELVLLGAPVDDPADPRCLAEAIACVREVGGGR